LVRTTPVTKICAGTVDQARRLKGYPNIRHGPVGTLGQSKPSLIGPVNLKPQDTLVPPCQNPMHYETPWTEFRFLNPGRPYLNGPRSTLRGPCTVLVLVIPKRQQSAHFTDHMISLVEMQDVLPFYRNTRHP